MILKRKVANQKIPVFAWDTVAEEPKTGDSSNITAYISLDGGTPVATNDTNPTELDSANQPGIYVFDLTQDETDADMIILSAKSSTTGVVIQPVVVSTVASMYLWKRTA